MHIPAAFQVHAAWHPQSKGRPDGPDAVFVRPVGVAVPLLAGAGAPRWPPRHSTFGNPRVQRPTRSPERAAAPWDRPLAHLAGTAATLADLRESPRGVKDERGLLGRNAGPRRKQLEATNFPSFLFLSRGQRLSPGSILVKSRAGRFHLDSTLSKYK